MNRTYSILGAALLASMSSIAWAAAGEGGGGGGDPVSLEGALKMLSVDTDDHWTEGGLPLIDRLKGMTGSDVTRAEVDEITDGTKREGWAEWRKTKWPAPADPDVAAAVLTSPALIRAMM